MAVSISISVTQNSQSVTDNASNVTVSVRASWTYGSFNQLQKSGWLMIDGTKYSFSSSFNANQSTSGSQTLFSKTVNIAHGSDGTKTLACSASYTSGVSSGTVTASTSKVLTTIPRKSSLTAANGTLGTSQTLSVTRQASTFTHTITYKCGSISGTVCTKSSSTSISWTPPIALASQNTTGTSVSITLTIVTYSGSTNVGSNTKTISCAIPASIKPSCTLTVTDPTGYSEKYGNPVKGLSKFNVVVTSTTSYGSAIASYSTTVNGATYAASSFTTGVLTASGAVTLNAKVTDKRGRSGSASISKTVIDYSAPVITKLTVHRCDSDGTENDRGESIRVSFSANVTSLNGLNSASYILRYRKASDSEFTDVKLNEYNGSYSVTDGSYIILSADSGSSYSVEFQAADSHNVTKRATSVSTGFTLMHWNTSGNGMGIGKVSELQNVLDIGVQTRFYGGLRPVILEPETDLNTVLTPNTYIGENINSYNYANCPVSNGTFTLVVESCGEDGQYRQTYSSCSKVKPERYSRFYYQSSWGKWFWASTDEYVLYENSAGSNETITLLGYASNYRYIEIYYTDNNGKTGGYTKVWNPNGKIACLHIQEGASPIYSRQTRYTISGATLTPDVANASYFRINSDNTISTSFGTNYIKIVRVIGRA